ncbi:hypothetical protein DACRYDRAFT_104602 [Dacryopinax primogenitus]|uniref:Uncharacterized protein n=1 Tax=Dacryopinax primogenitus (strain DJM 731) TaxID=1858805 RepID=M5GG21_DACPD|nr:uncharacterized protein DACRYDRAFT_104602 [Dacryopinax primogenitus]EJU04728.1 hypothetical protein DACRYDRAFT_104602 [Dacryopinax primogenitus]
MICDHPAMDLVDIKQLSGLLISSLLHSAPPVKTLYCVLGIRSFERKPTTPTVRRTTPRPSSLPDSPPQVTNIGGVHYVYRKFCISLRFTLSRFPVAIRSDRDPADVLFHRPSLLLTSYCLVSTCGMKVALHQLGLAHLNSATSRFESVFLVNI